MKQNIMIVSFDYDLSKRITSRLAEDFCMRTLDQLELFDFDHIPLSFGDVLAKSGESFVKKELLGSIKMELDFDNVAFTALLNVVSCCKELYFRIKLSNFVVLLKKDINNELTELSQKNFPTKQEKKFFSVSRNELLQQENSIENDCADICINIDNMSEESIVREIEREIMAYYKLDN